MCAHLCERSIAPPVVMGFGFGLIQKSSHLVNTKNVKITSGDRLLSIELSAAVLVARLDSVFSPIVGCGRGLGILCVTNRTYYRHWPGVR